MDSGEFNPGRIRWDCRRGIKEAEYLLLPFFDRYFADLTLEQKRAFVLLLKEQDVDLFEWFTLRSEPEDEVLRNMVRLIMDRCASSS
ncbi:conserved hypothetical protein [gamma proteobacterium HdN1]|nr:conserved hypothetical protein [gamma proteobacterium HdN1]